MKKVCIGKEEIHHQELKMFMRNYRKWNQLRTGVPMHYNDLKR